MTAEPSRKIGFEIASIGNLIKRYSPVKPNIDDRIPRMQMWIIGYIRDHCNTGDVFQGALEREFNITRATASSILKRMERDGLITRESVSHDARLKKILLTPKAIRKSDDVRRHIDEKEKLMAKDISQEELDIFFGVLDKVRDNLTKACE